MPVPPLRHATKVTAPGTRRGGRNSAPVREPLATACRAVHRQLAAHLRRLGERGRSLQRHSRHRHRQRLQPEQLMGRLRRPASGHECARTARISRGEVEATSGFEPLNRGFADPPLNHLGTSPRARAGQGSGVIGLTGCPSRIRTSPNGSKVRCPTTRRRGRGSKLYTDDQPTEALLTPSAPPSGRRDSNPRPSPWQGDALPTEPRPHGPA